MSWKLVIYVAVAAAAAVACTHPLFGRPVLVPTLLAASAAAIGGGLLGRTLSIRKRV
jgi:uncharacterized membrane protein YjjB (DUF3815 family)